VDNPTAAECIAAIAKVYDLELVPYVLDSKVVAVVEHGKTVRESLMTAEGRRAVYDWASALGEKRGPLEGPTGA
jgi:hypothetical protein